MEITQMPIAKAKMPIRRQAADVFEAFIDPTISSKFWFTKGSSHLENDKRILWEREMNGVSIEVEVKELEKNKRILIEWDGSSGRTTGEWILSARKKKEPFVAVTESG